MIQISTFNKNRTSTQHKQKRKDHTCVGVGEEEHDGDQADRHAQCVAEHTESSKRCIKLVHNTEKLRCASENAV